MKLYSFMWLFIHRSTFDILRVIRVYFYQLFFWSPCILPKPGQPSAQLSKLIRLTACKKTKNAVSRWYRTVNILWLVASYDTHNCKCWLNSIPQATEVKVYNYMVRVIYIFGVQQYNNVTQYNNNSKKLLIGAALTSTNQ